MVEIETDVLVVGAGGAGMYAGVAAARAGARVLLADKSMVGRGGATIMAQMTVAAAVAEQGPDDWTRHLADTLEAGRGLVDENLAALLCEGAVERIRELDEWKVGCTRTSRSSLNARESGKAGSVISRSVRWTCEDEKGKRRRRKVPERALAVSASTGERGSLTSLG